MYKDPCNNNVKLGAGWKSEVPHSADQRIVPGVENAATSAATQAGNEPASCPARRSLHALGETTVGGPRRLYQNSLNSLARRDSRRLCYCVTGPLSEGPP